MKLNTNIRILIHLAAPSIAITVSLKGKVMQKRYSKLYIQHIKNLKTLNKLILTGPCFTAQNLAYQPHMQYLFTNCHKNICKKFQMSDLHLCI